MAAKASNIDNILNQVEQLGYTEKINLLEKVILLLKKENEAKKQLQLSSISGLGADIWRDINIDNYVENERQWD